ncbi:MAG: cupin domain-containing protein [Verrucomicrobia bacterium]|nr:cupin domain-containing protein [Verrucomicrobiota bacterium]MDA1067022.1 cupin domain-containing protein [Verrucomicrobiota bacterium]
MIPNKNRLESLKTRLGLRPLGGEGGLFTEAYVSNLMVEATDGPSPASNCIYYALTKDQPQNHLHHLVSDDYHILIEGGPADYYIFHPEGKAESITLGCDLEAGQKMVVATPANCWKAIRLNLHAKYVLIGSVVTPAWNPNRITIGSGQSFIDTYVGKADWATTEFLRSLIGPNWEETLR